MGVKSLPVRKEVLEAGYQPAPKLGQILEFLEKGTGPRGVETMAKAELFFDRTVITESMLQIFEAIIEAFEGKRKRVFLLRSFYGGGKTHTLLAILHAFREPDSLKKIKGVSPNIKMKLEEIAERIKNLRVKIVCLAGDNSVYSGSPLAPTNVANYAYRTVWGYIAHALGSYSAMKEFDETLTAPQENLIRKMLEGERVLFLFDEVAEYINNFVGGAYRDYARSVVNFMEFFCKAVSSSKCVSLITLPFEGETAEFRFKDLDLVISLRNAIEKDAENFEPLKAREVVEILKKRIFESLPISQRELAVERFKEARVNFPNYFTPNYEEDVGRCYPFSPEYMEVLERLVRETGLQKTRAAIEITIDVVKRVLESGTDPEVIKPWHIELSKFPDVFINRGEYQAIYAKQVLVEPEIHSIILKTIFYYTFYYDTPSTRREYPGVNEIVRAVYEPETFTKLNITIADIENELAKIKNRDDVLNLYFSEGKFWFWRLPSVRDYINKTARRVLKSEDPRIWDYIKEALTDSFNYAGTKRSKIQLTHGFKELVILESYDYPEESDKLRLVVLLKSELAAGDFPRDIIMESEAGKSRTNKNTLAILLPREPFREMLHADAANYNETLELASKLVAMDEVEDRIGEWYADPQIVEIQKKMLSSERSRVRRELDEKIVRTYSWILFPAHPDIHYEKITEPSMNIAEGAWRALRRADKVADKIELSYLLSVIKTHFGIDVERDEKAWEFRTIKSWFKQFPSLPFVSDDMIEKAVKEGVRMFKFGIRTENNIFFKPVHSSIPPAKDSEGVVPNTIGDRDIVMTKEKAINEQMEFLLSRETTTETLTHFEETRFLLYPDLGGSGYLLSSLRERPNWKNMFLDGVIVKEFRKIPKDVPRLDVKVYPGESLQIGKNETAKLRISAIPYNFSPEKVEIEITSRGRLILSELMNRLNGEFVKEFEVIPELDEETYTITIFAKPEKVKAISRTLKIKKKKEEKKKLETRDIGDGHIGYRIIEISDIRDFEVLKTLEREKILTFTGSKLEGSPKAIADGEIIGKEGDGTMKLTLDNMPADVAVSSSLELAEYCTEKTIGSFKIRFENTVLDRRLVDSLKKLNKKVKFVLETEEK